MLKVEGHSDLVRDANGAIISVSDDYHKYIEQRNMRQREAEKLSRLENEVSELKSMVLLLLEKNK